jgi:uncharacterized membrane protein YgcG
MDQQHKRESHYENQQNEMPPDRSQVSRQRLFETVLMTVVALVSLAVFGTLASTVPAVVVMLGAYAFVMTMPVVVPYVTVRVVTVLLRRWELR